MKTSFEALQDFVQLPLVFFWQKQLRKVVHQALAQELSSLPRSLQAESEQQEALRKASQHSTHTMTQQPQAVQATLPEQAGHHDKASVPAPARTGLSSFVRTQTDSELTSAEELTDSTQKGPEPQLPHSLPSQLMTSAQGLLPSTEEEQKRDPASLSSLPVEAPARPGFRQTSFLTPAGQGTLPEQATQRGLPKQASPVQPTFLRMCLAEVLRLTNPAQSQFQPLLCGWYTSGPSLPPFA